MCTLQNGGTFQCNFRAFCSIDMVLNDELGNKSKIDEEIRNAQNQPPSFEQMRF